MDDQKVLVTMRLVSAVFMLLLLVPCAYAQTKTSDFGFLAAPPSEQRQGFTPIENSAPVRGRFTPIDGVDHVQQLPDLSQIPKWGEIATSARFMALPDDEKAKLKESYFDNVIAPHASASGEDVQSLRRSFMAQRDTKPVDLLKIAYFYVAVIVMAVTVWKRKKIAFWAGYIVSNGVRIALVLLALLAFVVVFFWPQSYNECVRQAARDAQGGEQAIRWLVGICNEKENAKWWQKK